MFWRGFFFMRFFGALFFAGLFVLACAGIYNLGLNQGYTQALLVEGSESAGLPSVIPFLPGWTGGTAPFIALAGLCFLGFLFLGALGLIFGRRAWSRPENWRGHYDRHHDRYGWGCPPWVESEKPSEREDPGQGAESGI